MTDETQSRINSCLKDTISTMMKQHELQIQSIINSTSKPNPLTDSNESPFNDPIEGRCARVSHVNTDTNHEQCSKREVSNRNTQLEQLNAAISDDESQTVSQLYANEQNELKYLLIRDELVKRQTILDEVLLINEALQIKIRENELDSLKLPHIKIPVAHSSVQTDDFSDYGQNKCLSECGSPGQTTIDEREIGGSSLTFERDSLDVMKEMISKLKIDGRKRKRKVEKLTLKNFSMKLEICELKKEIKKYASVWANDRYFNSLFLDATKLSMSK